MSDVPQVPMIRLTPPAWKASLGAVQDASRAATDSSDDFDRDVAWRELAQKGLAVRADELEPQWRELVQAVASARAGFRFVAEQGGMEHRADITLGRINTCLLSRRELGRGPDGLLAPVRVDRELEFTAAVADPWLLVRSILPPVEALLAPPRQTPPDQVKPVSTEPIAGGVVDDRSPQRSSVAEALDMVKPSEAVRDILASHTYVGYAAWLLGDVGGSDSALMGYRHWLVGKGLYRLGSHGGHTGWLEVQPGDLAFEFTWNRLGLQDAITRSDGRSTA